MTLAQAQEAYLSKMDIDYSYQLAKSMEQFRSNPALGYRTAGSRAEFETGEMLFHEMRRIGLQEVVKDPFTLDTCLLYTSLVARFGCAVFLFFRLKFGG